MLDFRKVKSQVGMKLLGDYSTLGGLHELIHKVASSSPLLRGLAGRHIAGVVRDGGAMVRLS